MLNARTLTQTLGGDWHGQSGLAPCPVCQPERRLDQRGLAVSDNGDKLLAHCHRSHCKFRDIIRAVDALPDALTRPAQPTVQSCSADAEKKAQLARRLWDSARPLPGTKGEAYLRGRNITCPLPSSLRWLRDCFHHSSGRYLPAIVARVSTGGIHRTLLETDGDRIKPKAKLMLGPCSGGAVRLFEDTGPLVVSEGIETALSLMCGPIQGPASLWAALSTAGVRSLHLPAQPGDLIIALDNDPAGMAAAQALADRASALGWSVSLMLPPAGCNDWNDHLRAAGEGQSRPPTR